jgi:hypothetical protein
MKLITEELEVKTKAKIKEVLPEISDEKVNELFDEVNILIKEAFGLK